METEIAERAAAQVGKAASAERCRCCGCFHGVLIMLEDMLPEEAAPAVRDKLIEKGRHALEAVRYNCLGCEPCLPMEALKILKGMED